LHADPKCKLNVVNPHRDTVDDAAFEGSLTMLTSSRLVC
jgi:hypothetical protein